MALLCATLHGSILGDYSFWVITRWNILLHDGRVRCILT